MCRDRNQIVFLTVEDSKISSNKTVCSHALNCILHCPHVWTIMEYNINPDSGGWVGANLANEHVVSIIMWLLARWVARCQVLNVEEATEVKVPSPDMIVFPKSALGPDWDSANQGVSLSVRELKALSDEHKACRSLCNLKQLYSLGDNGMDNSAVWKNLACPRRGWEGKGLGSLLQVPGVLDSGTWGSES